MNQNNHSGIPAIVVGSGHGLRIHLPGLRAAGFNVVALVGNDPERTARRADRAGIPRAFTDLDTAIAETGARAVTIASPPHTHGQMVLTAVARGCHVLSEKPFARDAEEAGQLLAAVEQAGVIHLLGNQFRVLPERILIARAIAEGAIGKARLLTMIQHVSLMTTGIQWPEWWLDPNAGGGWLGASGSHMIGQAHSWLGRIARLSANRQSECRRS